MGINALKGVDARIAMLLQLAAADFGFHLGFASVLCHLTGTADRHYEGEHAMPGQALKPEEDWQEIDERDVQIRDFVDVEGKFIAEKLDFVGLDETIPQDLSEDVEKEQHYKENCAYDDVRCLVRCHRRSSSLTW